MNLSRRLNMMNSSLLALKLSKLHVLGGCVIKESRLVSCVYRLPPDTSSPNDIAEYEERQATLATPFRRRHRRNRNERNTTQA